MKSADISKGMQVLATSMPSYSSKFSLIHARLVTVVQVGVVHSYRTEGSFTEWGKNVTRDNGVLVRWEDGEESVKRPEHLHPATGANLETWQRHQDRRAQEDLDRSARMVREEAIVIDFEELLDVGASFSGGNLVLNADQAERIITKVREWRQ
jgi:hypothetical protein